MRERLDVREHSQTGYRAGLKFLEGDVERWRPVIAAATSARVGIKDALSVNTARTSSVGTAISRSYPRPRPAC